MVVLFAAVATFGAAAVMYGIIKRLCRLDAAREVAQNQTDEQIINELE